MKRKRRVNLIDARKSSGETQAETAKAIGISYVMYTYIEQGQRNPSDDTKERIAEHFGEKVGHLFFEEPITQSNK